MKKREMLDKLIESKMHFWINHRGAFNKDRAMEATDLAVCIRQLEIFSSISFSALIKIVVRIASRKSNMFEVQGERVWIDYALPEKVIRALGLTSTESATKIPKVFAGASKAFRDAWKKFVAVCKDKVKVNDFVGKLGKFDPQKDPIEYLEALNLFDSDPITKLAWLVIIQHQAESIRV